MAMSLLPPCGLYRTSRDLSEAIPAGRLVFFHDHGDPGPGVYLPSGWAGNRARFHARGLTLEHAAAQAATLEPLLAEGFYVVATAFTCCEKDCRTYVEGELVQLGYNGRAEALLFIPEWKDGGLHLPEKGTRVDGPRLSRLSRRDAFRHTWCADQRFDQHVDRSARVRSAETTSHYGTASRRSGPSGQTARAPSGCPILQHVLGCTR